MAITVETPATNTNLTTVEMVKLSLELPSTDDTHDEFLSYLVRMASDAIHTYTGRYFPRETVVETIKGYGLTELLLSRRPIVSVSQVLMNSNPLTDYSVRDSNAGILYRAAGWDWTAKLGYHLVGWPNPGSEEPSFSVHYTGGYTVPADDPDTYTLDGSIVQAATETVATWWRMRLRDPNLVRKQVGNLSLFYSPASDKREGGPITPLPVAATLRLQQFKQEGIPAYGE